MLRFPEQSIQQVFRRTEWFCCAYRSNGTARMRVLSPSESSTCSKSCPALRAVPMGCVTQLADSHRQDRKSSWRRAIFSFAIPHLAWRTKSSACSRCSKTCSDRFGEPRGTRDQNTPVPNSEISLAEAMLPQPRHSVPPCCERENPLLFPPIFLSRRNSGDCASEIPEPPT